MNNNLRKYAFDLAEDYLIFMEQYHEGNREWISPAAYARARIKNMQDELLRYTIEQIDKEND